MHTLNEMMVAGCTTQRGLHFWEEKGLLGKVERTSGGNRQYTSEQMDRARIIAAAKFGGWELDEIKPMILSYDEEAHGALLRRLSSQAELAMRLIESLPKPAGDAAQEYDL